LEEERRPVGEEGVSLHLSESDSSGSFSTLAEKKKEKQRGKQKRISISTRSRGRRRTVARGIKGMRRTNLNGLSSERVDGSGRSDLELVVDHVSETLVVDDAEVDVCRELLAGDSRVHGLVSEIIVTRLEELLAKVVDGRVVVREPGAAERSGRSISTRLSKTNLNST
jgi:hypothetical protein